MIMIIGGAYQGKLAFAKKIYPDVTWADGAVCTEEELYSCEGIYHFHQYIERKIKEGEPIDDLAEELIRKNPELILITDEIGYGIVPVDRMEREYREQTGRAVSYTHLAQKKWNSIAKPLHSLGKLEDHIMQIAALTGDTDVNLNRKALIVMCADNGVVEEGVTQTRCV